MGATYTMVRYLPSILTDTKLSISSLVIDIDIGAMQFCEWLAFFTLMSTRMPTSCTPI